jgi:hypothetical protein
MKSYKEHSQLERANMTSDDVESLLKIELMGAGIVEVKEPAAPEEPPKFEPPVEMRVYQPSVNADYRRELGFGFLNEDDAKLFAEMKIVCVDEDYTNKLKNAKETKGGTAIALVETVSVQSLRQARTADNVSSNVTNAYSNALSDFEAYQRDRDAVLDPVWEDWRDMQSIHMKSQQLLTVFSNYIDTCVGDEELAMKFLKKAYTDKAIQDAYEFLEMDCPIHEGMAI